jgi:hypothetical protein
LFLVTLCFISVFSAVDTSFLLSVVEAAPISPQAQMVVDDLEAKGYDVTFVYFGSNKTLTFGTEDCAVVVMKTFEHVKNFKFLPSHEAQFKEGNNSLAKAYSNAEVFIVFLFEDIDKNGVPDGYNGYYEISGGVFGGRTETAFYTDYWVKADDFVAGNSSLPTQSPAPTPTPQPTAQPNKVPTLELSCKSSISSTDLKIDITGRLSENNTGIPSAQILVSYSVDAGNSWIGLTTAVTNGNGDFFEVWTPQISFSVNGTSGTSGYVNLYLPKSLVNDVSALIVSLDDTPIDYTATSQEDSIQITFSYQHSAHQIIINVNSPDQTTAKGGGDTWLIIGAIAAAVGIVMAGLIMMQRKRKTP